MKNYLNAIPWIIVSLLLSMMFVYRECNRPVKIEYLPGDTITRTNTIKGDSIPVPYPVVEIQKEDSIVYVEVPAIIDSAGIILDYFAKRYYDIDIIDDSLLYVRIEAMVQENKLKWVVPYRQIRRPQVVNHYTTIIQQVEIAKKIQFKGGLFALSYPGGFDGGGIGGIQYKRYTFHYGRGIGKTNLFTFTIVF